jgi:hypothetical protein
MKGAVACGICGGSGRLVIASNEALRKPIVL